MCKHEWSGLNNSVNELKKAVPNATIDHRLAIKGTIAHSSDQLLNIG